MNKEIYNYAIFLISKQDYSKTKLTKKLDLKYPQFRQDTHLVIEILEERGYIRLEYYKRVFIKKWLLKGESEKKIRMRGAIEDLEFTQEDFREAQENLGLTQDDNIQKLIDKKIRSKIIPIDPMEKRRLKDKVLRFLLSKGYSLDIAISEINKRF